MHLSLPILSFVFYDLAKVSYEIMDSFRVVVLTCVDLGKNLKVTKTLFFVKFFVHRAGIIFKIINHVFWKITYIISFLVQITYVGST